MSVSEYQSLVASAIKRGLIGFRVARNASGWKNPNGGRKRRNFTTEELLKKLEWERERRKIYMREWRHDNPEKAREHARNGMRKLRARLASATRPEETV